MKKRIVLTDPEPLATISPASFSITPGKPEEKIIHNYEVCTEPVVSGKDTPYIFHFASRRFKKTGDGRAY